MFGLKSGALALVVMLAGSGVVVGQERLITVTGHGSVELIPDTVVATFSVVGSSETVAGALVEFQRNRQRIEDTLNPMDFPGVTLEFQGKVVSDGQLDQMQVMVFGGGGMPEEAAGTASISESFQVKMTVGESGVTDARLGELTRIVDAAVSAKARPGSLVADMYDPSGMMGGIVTAASSDTKVGEKEAARAAFEDAREKAALLAELGGIELGEVHSIEMDSGAELPTVNWGPKTGNAGESPLVGSKINIKSSLIVKFSVTSKTP